MKYSKWNNTADTGPTLSNDVVTTMYDWTSIRRPFDCLSEVIKVTVT